MVGSRIRVMTDMDMAWMMRAGGAANKRQANRPLMVGQHIPRR